MRVRSKRLHIQEIRVAGQDVWAQDIAVNSPLDAIRPPRLEALEVIKCPQIVAIRRRKDCWTSAPSLDLAYQPAHRVLRSIQMEIQCGV